MIHIDLDLAIARELACIVSGMNPKWCVKHNGDTEFCNMEWENRKMAFQGCATCLYEECNKNDANCSCLCHASGTPQPKPRNPHYLKLIEKIKQVHESKSHDYAKENNVFSNFEYAGIVAAIFTDPTDKAFAILIGVKLARLAELRSGKKPKNEPLLDTIEDMTNYSAIWGSMIMKELEEAAKSGQ